MTVAKLALATVAGFVVLVLLFPASGVDTLPPQCYSVFGYVVPCNELWAGTATAVIVGLTVRLKSRRT